MPDFLTAAQAELRARAETLGAELAALAELKPDSPLDSPVEGSPVDSPADSPMDSQDSPLLAEKVRAASQAAGIWQITQPRAADPEPEGAADLEAAGAADSDSTGAGALELVIVREALAAHNVAHLPGLFAPSGGLLAAATEPLRSQVLPRYLSGDLRGSFGFTEPADATHPTRARRDGDDLVINGQKSYVTGGGDADFINTLVEIEGRGPTIVFVPTDTAGLELTRRFGTLDGSHHCHFTFTDVAVPKTNIVGEAGQGLRRSLGQISAVRMEMSATCVGLAGFVLAEVERYLTERKKRDGEAARQSLGEMRTQAFAARSVTYRTARLIDCGDAAINEVMATKAFATETLSQLVDAAIQIVGGQALADDHRFSSIYRRARALRLAEGSTEVLYANIARGRLELELGRI